MLVAVTGLAREARLIASPGVVAISGGGDAASLQQRLSDKLAKGARHVLSIGVCGALSPDLRVGDAILASEVIDGTDCWPTNDAWTREIAKRLPDAIVAPLAATNEIIADRDGKARLRAATHASAVDMESHIAARAAEANGLPFAVLRVVSDAAHRALPPAALIAMHPSGGIDFLAVLRSLLRKPLQIPALIRTAWEAEIAFASLLRCRNMLDGRFAGADLGELALDVT